MPTQSGSHAAVWRALKESGNANWRKAGNQGKTILEYRHQADYDGDVAGLIFMMHSTLRMAGEILLLLK